MLQKHKVLMLKFAVFAHSQIGFILTITQMNQIVVKIVYIIKIHNKASVTAKKVDFRQTDFPVIHLRCGIISFVWGIYNLASTIIMSDDNIVCTSFFVSIVIFVDVVVYRCMASSRLRNSRFLLEVTCMSLRFSFCYLCLSCFSIRISMIPSIV